MPNTYKTVINNAITGFNDIQNLINTNSGQLTQVSNTDAGIASIAEIKSALGPAALSCDLIPAAKASEAGVIMSTDNYSIATTAPETSGYVFVKLNHKESCTTAGLVGTGIKADETKYVKIKTATNAEIDALFS